MIYRPLFVEADAPPLSLSIPERIALRARQCHQLGLTEIELSREELCWLHEYSVYRFASEIGGHAFGLKIVLHE